MVYRRQFRIVQSDAEKCSDLRLQPVFGSRCPPTRFPEEANEAVQMFLSEELGQLYVQRYFSAEAKAEIEDMVQLMIGAFKTRINRLDWMSEPTKQEAIKKLENLTVLIGYPDEWDMNNADIQSVAQGGSYFANAAASRSREVAQDGK